MNHTKDRAAKAAAAALVKAGGANADKFDADARAAERMTKPVVIAGVTYKRRKKDWDTSRLMRKIMRAQEGHVARSTRLRRRIAELEVEQMEAAGEGATDREADLEGKIEELITQADESTEEAELASYKLVRALLTDEQGEPLVDADGEPLAADDDLVAVLQSTMDVEDVAALARELSGSVEPDPQTTTSSDAT